MKLIKLLSRKYVHTLAHVFSRFIFFAITLVILASCAQQGQITGGEKDVTPPRILESAPQNKALNFTGNEWYFEFDEYVRVAGAQKELLVTPPLKYPVEFKMRGRKVTVVWQDTLLEETTYMFQFGDGIVDVNEGNPLDSNVFVFSTGDYLDSFSLRGKVIDAFTLKPVEDIWVMLYAENLDSLPYKELPRYFARTDEDGRYELRYLAQGNYKVFALQAVNGGYLYDQPDEAIAFLDSLWPAFSPVDSTAIDLQDLRLFTEEDTLQYIADYEQIGNRGLSFQFNRPADAFELIEINGQEILNWDAIWNTKRDSLVYWFPEPWNYDSLHLAIQLDDFMDTLYLRKPSTGNKGKGRGKQQEEERLKLAPSSTARILHFKPFSLTSQTPLAAFDWTDALLVEAKDSMELAEYVRTEDRKILIDYPWKQGENYRVFIPDSAVTDRFGLTNDTLKFSLIASKVEDFGTFKLNYQLPEHGHDYILQLQQNDGKLVQENVVKASGSITYEYLKTGAYKLKLLYDENNNGKWDTGNYLRGEQPEQVAFFDQAIDLRSNWVTEIDWDFRGTDAEQENEDSQESKVK